MNSDQTNRSPSSVIKASSGHIHKVLVVDDEAPVGKAIGRILDREGLEYTYAASGEEGLGEIEKSETRFSLILSDQRMPGMLGTDFLARAKEITPETVRFLVTGYSEMETILKAVNQGAVQHFISKPWDRDEFRRIIRNGIAMSERHLESEKLFALAKRQNAKLYELNCELIESTKELEGRKKDLDREIEALTARLQSEGGLPDSAPGKVISDLTAWLVENGETDALPFKALQVRTLAALYEQFSDLALRNGLEMPEIHLPGTGAGSAP